MKKVPHILIPFLLVAAVAVRPAPAQTGAATGTLATSLSPAYHPTLDLALVDPTASTGSAASLPLPKYGNWVGVTKWLTLATAVGLGTAGVLLHKDANEMHLRLEVLCNASPDNCRDREPDGSYVDPVLEGMYESILKKDRQARAMFIGSEVTFFTSVLLFIVDFQKRDGPGNVPYDPDSEKADLQFTAVPGEIALRYYLQ
jgi:hypothetical protein